MNLRYREYIIPFLVSAIVTMILVRSLPFLTVKYHAEITEQVQKPQDIYDFYCDLDGNGVTERIVIYYNAAGHIAISISTSDPKTINQFNLPGSFLRQGDLFDIEDVNSDGILDFLMCTIRKDSLFLNVIDDIHNRPTSFKSFFIEKVNQYNDYGDYLFSKGQVGDANGDGSPEYYFSINGGHALQPRAVYAVNMDDGKLYRSPLSGTAVFGIDFFDLDNDGSDEVLLKTASPENFKSHIPFRDSTSWLMVLDQDLSFYRDPVEMPGAPSWIHPSPFFFEGRNYLLVFRYYRGPGNDRSELSVFDDSMTEIRSQRTDQMGYDIRSAGNPWHSNQIEDILLFTEDQALIPDFNLEIIDSIPNQKAILNAIGNRLDIDGDGSEEFVWLNTSNLIIASGDLRDLTTLDLELPNVQNRPVTLFSVIRNGKKPPILLFQIDHNQFYISYRRNPWYHIRYLSHIILFLSLFGFTLLLVILQRRVIEKRYEKDRLINRLQLQTLKNQLDPHFTYNTLNAIGSLIYKEDKDLAYKYLQILTDLLRIISNEAIEIKWFLEDELDFVRKYLELQKLRFREQFDFTIRLNVPDPEKYIIPKMAILSFVENAVKHGLNASDTKNLIDIRAEENMDSLKIEIEDNGIGRKASLGLRGESEGRGNQMMRNYFDLFSKVTGKKAKFVIEDLYYEDAQPAGTRVLITIK